MQRTTKPAGARKAATGRTDTTQITDVTARRPPQPARTLDRLVQDAGTLEGVHKNELSLGDQVIVTTRNSSYAIFSLGDGRYSVSGGWFDRRGASPATTTINGCTWGGTAIHTELVACPGLRLEFGNKVVTTRIRSVTLIRSATHTRVH